jgi:hypothetical protein
MRSRKLCCLVPGVARRMAQSSNMASFSEVCSVMLIMFSIVARDIRLVAFCHGMRQLLLLDGDARWWRVVIRTDQTHHRGEAMLAVVQGACSTEPGPLTGGALLADVQAAARTFSPIQDVGAGTLTLDQTRQRYAKSHPSRCMCAPAGSVSA